MSMKKNFITIISAGFGVCALLAGCGEEHQAPPSERNQLVNRFFRSMETGNSVSATSQGQKLLAMDPGNDYIAKLVNIQQSNSYVERAQKLVNAGDVAGALAVVEEGLKVYPLNRTLSQLRGQLRQLRHAKMLIANMRSAKSSSAMTAALTAATTGLSSNRTEKLESYFKTYRQRIAETAAREQAAAVAEPVVPARPAER